MAQGMEHLDHRGIILLTAPQAPTANEIVSVGSGTPSEGLQLLHLTNDDV